MMMGFGAFIWFRSHGVQHYGLWRHGFRSHVLLQMLPWASGAGSVGAWPLEDEGARGQYPQCASCLHHLEVAYAYGSAHPTPTTSSARLIASPFQTA